MPAWPTRRSLPSAPAAVVAGARAREAELGEQVARLRVAAAGDPGRTAGGGRSTVHDPTWETRLVTMTSTDGSLRIAQVAPPLEAVPPPATAGPSGSSTSWPASSSGAATGHLVRERATRPPPARWCPPSNGPSGRPAGPREDGPSPWPPSTLVLRRADRIRRDPRPPGVRRACSSPGSARPRWWSRSTAGSTGPGPRRCWPDPPAGAVRCQRGPGLGPAGRPVDDRPQRADPGRAPRSAPIGARSSASSAGWRRRRAPPRRSRSPAGAAVGCGWRRRSRPSRSSATTTRTGSCRPRGRPTSSSSASSARPSATGCSPRAYATLMPGRLARAVRARRDRIARLRDPGRGPPGRRASPRSSATASTGSSTTASRTSPGGCPRSPASTGRRSGRRSSSASRSARMTDDYERVYAMIAACAAIGPRPDPGWV